VSAGRGAVLWTVAAVFVARSLAAGEVALPPRRAPLPQPLSSKQAAAHVFRLAWLDVSDITRGVDDIARSETRSILKETGLDVVWRRGRAGELARPGEVRVILLQRSLFDGRSAHPVLGSTPPGARQCPNVWIHVGSVQAALGLRSDLSAKELRPRARRDLGVALGRVVAHEVVHAVAPSVEHEGELMSETLTRGELTRARLSLAPATAVAVRAAVLGLSAPGQPGSGLRAATGDAHSAPVGDRAPVRGGGGSH
jgi:hypothetical protein